MQQRNLKFAAFENYDDAELLSCYNINVYNMPKKCWTENEIAKATPNL